MPLGPGVLGRAHDGGQGRGKGKSSGRGRGRGRDRGRGRGRGREASALDSALVPRATQASVMPGAKQTQDSGRGQTDRVSLAGQGRRRYGTPACRRLPSTAVCKLCRRKPGPGGNKLWSMQHGGCHPLSMVRFGRRAGGQACRAGEMEHEWTSGRRRRVDCRASPAGGRAVIGCVVLAAVEWAVGRGSRKGAKQLRRLLARWRWSYCRMPASDLAVCVWECRVMEWENDGRWGTRGRDMGVWILGTAGDKRRRNGQAGWLMIRGKPRFLCPFDLDAV